MKKRFFNPKDMFECKFLFFVSITILFGLLLKLIIDSINNSLTNESLWAATLMILLFPGLFIIFCAIIFIRWRGYFFEDGEYIVFKKGKKQEKVAIKDVKRIEIKTYVRMQGRSAIGAKQELEWQFIIILNDKKKLPFLITNEEILDIATKWNIRTIPNDFAEQVSMKLKARRKKRKKKNKEQPSTEK